MKIVSCDWLSEVHLLSHYHVSATAWNGEVHHSMLLRSQGNVTILTIGLISPIHVCQGDEIVISCIINGKYIL